MASCPGYYPTYRAYWPDYKCLSLGTKSSSVAVGPENLPTRPVGHPTWPRPRLVVGVLSLRSIACGCHRCSCSAARYYMQWQAGPREGDQTPPDLVFSRSKHLPGLACLHARAGGWVSTLNVEVRRGPFAPAEPALPLHVTSSDGTIICHLQGRSMASTDDAKGRKLEGGAGLGQGL